MESETTVRNKKLDFNMVITFLDYTEKHIYLIIVNKELATETYVAEICESLNGNAMEILLGIICR